MQNFLSRAVGSVVAAGDSVLSTDLTSAAVLLSSELGDQMFASLDVAALGVLLATFGVLGVGLGALFSIGQVDLYNTEKARAKRYQVPQTDFEIASERQAKGVNDEIMDSKRQQKWKRAIGAEDDAYVQYEPAQLQPIRVRSRAGGDSRQIAPALISSSELLL